MQAQDAGGVGIGSAHETIFYPDITINGEKGAYVKIIGAEEKATPEVVNGAAISNPGYAGEDTALTKAGKKISEAGDSIAEKIANLFKDLGKLISIQALLVILGGALILRIILK